jgi:hypothetical protein
MVIGLEMAARREVSLVHDAACSEGATHIEGGKLGVNCENLFYMWFRTRPSSCCLCTKDTPLMSWLKRPQVIGLRPGGGTDAGGNGGEGNSGSAGGAGQGAMSG